MARRGDSAGRRRYNAATPERGHAVGESPAATAAFPVPPRRRPVLRRAVSLGMVVFVIVATAVFVPMVLRRADRALVDGCRILYVGEDERLHLTNDAGTVDIELPGPPADARIWFSHSPPEWSPSGRRVAYLSSVSDSEKYIAVVEARTGQVWVHRSSRSGRFAGWYDDETLYEAHVGLRSATSGEVLAEVSPFAGFTNHVSRLPDGRGFVGTQPRAGVTLMDERFNQTRLISSERAGWVPRVDASGQWVGWTAFRIEEAPMRSVAIRRLSDPPETPPTYLGHAFGGAVFCDWTDDGNILANVAAPFKFGGSVIGRGPWRLVVMDRQGNVIREIPTAGPLLAESVASLRPAAAGAKR
jgi:hypothetical protein